MSLKIIILSKRTIDTKDKHHFYVYIYIIRYANEACKLCQYLGRMNGIHGKRKLIKGKHGVAIAKK